MLLCLFHHFSIIELFPHSNQNKIYWAVAVRMQLLLCYLLCSYCINWAAITQQNNNYNFCMGCCLVLILQTSYLYFIHLSTFYHHPSIYYIVYYAQHVEQNNQIFTTFVSWTIQLLVKNWTTVSWFLFFISFSFQVLVMHLVDTMRISVTCTKVQLKTRKKREKIKMI